MKMSPLISSHPMVRRFFEAVTGHRRQKFKSLTTKPLRMMTLLSKRFHDQFAMVPLDLNHTILDRPARTAGRAQLLAQHSQGKGIERQTFDNGHALTAPPFGLA